MCIYSKNGQCVILDVPSCEGDAECSFRLERSDLEKSREVSYKRIRGMQKYERDSISVKYYGGKTPWER